MTLSSLAARSLRHYWRSHLAVALGVGVAVSALAGALVVGDSVRASLRTLALARLGHTETLVTAQGLFTTALADRLRGPDNQDADWTDAVPLLALDGTVVHETSGRRATRVQVFGVDDRFWRMAAPGDPGLPADRRAAWGASRDAFLSADLARELGIVSGDALTLRAQKPSAIPAGVLQGRRDTPGRALRVLAAGALTTADGGDFSPAPRQGPTRSIFVPLARLQQHIERPGQASHLLFGRASVSAPSARTPSPATLAERIRPQLSLADLGLRLRDVGTSTLVIESESGYLTDALAEVSLAAGRDVGLRPVPVVTYLATHIRANGRETPSSLVTGLPADLLRHGTTRSTPPASPASADVPASPASVESAPIWLSQWEADDLQVRVGDTVRLEYDQWSDTDGLSHDTASFRLAGVLPMQGLAVDATLAPEYPGVSTTASIEDWDPPFPVDLSRVRPKDEAFWKQFRTAPKAFVRVEDGRRLWQSSYGSLTSIRLPLGERPVAEARAALEAALRARLLAPGGAAMQLAGFRVMPLRAEALAASAGTTDFGEYFVYFSVFVVVASLLLTVLFFRLGVEQRAAEVGLLGALGYPPRTVAGLFLREGAVLATAGAGIGSAGAVAYAALIMLALRTRWVDAVGTTALTVHVSAVPLAAGAAGGLAAALVCILLSLRALWRAPARQLMSGGWLDARPPGRTRHLTWTTAGSTVGALVLVALTARGLVPAVAGFFGAGGLLLVGGLSALALWLRGTIRRPFTSGPWPLIRFGIRNARYRPARSVLSVALVASATFLVVAVGAFRQGTGNLTPRHAGSGGYSLMAESVTPLMHHPGTDAGRAALGLPNETAGLQVARFRLRPGDDASCLNLYRPTQPRLLGATPEFIREGRFSFSASLAATDDERRNPWLLLERRFDDGTVPVIGDATSLAYALHVAVGEDIVMAGANGEPLRLRVVAALRDSVLQSELVMREADFVRLFPRIEGFRVFLISPPAALSAAAAATALEETLRDFGFDAEPVADRLAAFHRVENTYLSTFQALGALGLVLGTLGLGAVLLRNVIERQRELAVLRATGYTRTHLAITVLAESVFLLACGLALGMLCAAMAVGPTFAERGDALPVGATVALLGAVMASGLLSSALATHAMAKADLLSALKQD